jgi:hypothetical protein
MEEDKIHRLRELSRQRIRIVWEIASLDESRLPPDDRLLVEAMRLHPEYYDLWTRLDSVSDEELERDQSNPVMHVVIHQIIESQLAANNPPETAQNLARLLEQGLTRHDAVHEIGKALARNIAQLMKFQRPFNDQLYVRRLRRSVKTRKK